ncbi:Zn-dependent alcohol dehydrogenase [Halogeometricum borinquense DSM 11551]|uniref:Zn-dependent alcohol dehydrogenase n=2 Tax=Halogeometricum borinquense TaxID=60847 RepID=E4NV80_HALBP|nr:zinc-dependent alcohol dehydrogenase family protein [Halogeometricum borinquense]ADQ69069.1 Zn-dependent alcohol dehydrogenase [Halogeometricum borinquense DSM 11551]ELY29430.1 Zn-dependent alcohol dehydrogenase [Halogeometricum borinquense DSM 11551]RYJ08236.1 alcohol dehydrogenase [Halogeometricum borinquense]
MDAVVFQGVDEPLELRSVDRPDCDANGVVVETEACGICRSDWHAWQGDWEWLGIIPQPGLIFGHEPVGRIVEVGENVTRFSEGEMVTNPFNLSDGTCPYCRAGRGNICESSIPMGFVHFQKGAFAEEYSVRNADQNLIKVPEDVPAREIAGLGCRFATAFHGVSQRVDIKAGDWVAVHGCGGVGLSAVHTATALGGNVIAIDIVEEKLEFARDLGAVETINSTEVDDIPQAVKSITDGGRGVSVSVEALGISQTIKDSVNCLAPGGQHLQVGLTTSEEGGEVSLPIDFMVQDEREFYGTYGMPPHEYDDIFRMMSSGKIDPGKIVSETCSLGDIPSVMERLGEYDTMGIPVCTEF